MNGNFYLRTPDPKVRAHLRRCYAPGAAPGAGRREDPRDRTRRTPDPIHHVDTHANWTESQGHTPLKVL